MFRQDRTNPSTAVSNWRGRHDTPKAWPSTATSTWLNGGLFGGGFAYTTTGSPSVATYGIYTSITWTGSGSFIIASNPDSLTMDVWVVAGGGGGGGGKWGGVGGGGAGGARQFTGQAMAVGTMTVTIGAGGSGGSAGNDGNNGGDTTIGSITSMPGGGHGGASPGIGGCGGGDGQGTSTAGNGGAATPSTDDYGGDGRKGVFSWPTMYGGGGGGYFPRATDWSSLTPAASSGGYTNTTTGLVGGDGCTQTYRDGNASGTTNGTHRFCGGGGNSGVSYPSYNYWGRAGCHTDGNKGTGSAGSSNQRDGGGNGNSGTTSGSGGAGGYSSGGGGGAASGGASGSTDGFTGNGGSGGSGIVVVRFVTP